MKLLLPAPVFVSVLAAGLAACSGSDSDGDQSPKIEASAPLNDTGSIACGNAELGDAPCPQVGFPSQDAQQGRDAQALTGLLDKIGGGVAGFDWTKLGANGQALAIQDQAWVQNGSEASGEHWSCVHDNVTGLTWEVKESGEHERSGNHSYSWYSQDASINGGDPGRADGGTCSTSPCDTTGYVTWVNNAKLCGYSDWRLPSITELSSLAVVSKVLPAMDTSYFPNVPQPRFFSRQSASHDPQLAWYVYFSDGSVSFTNKGDASHLRLVRGGQ